MTTSWIRLVLWLVHLLLPVMVVMAGSNEEGLAFLKANKEKEGVVELPSGLQYKVLKKGAGDKHPLVDTPCSCHYAGTLIDGTQFDSSYDRGEPTTFAPNQVIKGWTEAMQLMVEGDKWELYIPAELGYGDRGSPPKIPGGSVLIFQMEILEIQGPGKLALKCNVQTLDLCSDKERTYIEKARAWTSSSSSNNHKGTDELVRLEKLIATSEKDMKPELAGWIKNRIFLLNQMFGTGSATANEEL